MEKELSVLLVEDEQDVCQEFAACVDTFDDIKIVAVTGNSSQAIDHIRDYLPDAIILDLELHHGSGNGLLVLRGLSGLALPARPYILVTTNNSSMITYELARQLGADFIMSKHQDDYSPQCAVDFLRMMKPVILSRAASALQGSPPPESPDVRQKRMTREVCNELDRVGISPKAVGYRYLIDAILLVAEEPRQNLCDIIGQKYGKTGSSVERAMQNAITKAWRTTPIDDLERFYTARVRVEKGVPTITEFVYYYANKIKNDY